MTLYRRPGDGRGAGSAQHKNPHEMRRRRGRLIATGIAVLGIAIAAYAAFGPGLPFQHPYEFRAVFSTSNQLQPGSDVRIGGLSVGSVTGLTPGPSNTTVITMRIDNRAVPIRTDAQLAIEPRLVLEGNYYVSVKPGTPEAPALPSGGTIPLAQTSGLVQLDQLIDTFTLPTRSQLVGSFTQLDRGLGPRSTANGGPEPGYDGLRTAVREFDGAFASIARAAQGAQGTRRGDLSAALSATGDLTSQLSENPKALSGLIASFDTTFAALSANDTALSHTLSQVDDVLRAAPTDLSAIDSALPSLTTLARGLQPALRQAPTTFDSVDPFLAQLLRLVQPRELPALLQQLKPVTANLPALESRLEALFPYLSSATECISRNLVPTLDTPIKDGPNTDGQPPWEELLHMAASLAGAGSNFDGNGTAVRLGINESEQALEGTIPGLGKVLMQGNIEGVSPTWLGRFVQPPYRPDEWCVDQRLPNLDSRYGQPEGFTPVSNSAVDAQQGDLASIRRALAARNIPGVIRALTPLLRLEGVPPLTQTPALSRRRSGPNPRPARAKLRAAPAQAAASPPARASGASAPAASPTGVVQALNGVLGRLGLPNGLTRSSP